MIVETFTLLNAYANPPSSGGSDGRVAVARISMELRGTYSGRFENLLHGDRYFGTNPITGNQRHFSDIRAVRAGQVLGHVVLRTK